MAQQSIAEWIGRLLHVKRKPKTYSEYREAKKKQ